jgi:hypothetical protein
MIFNINYIDGRSFVKLEKESEPDSAADLGPERLASFHG